MFRRISLGVAAAAIAAATVATPALATDGPAFSITFYSDATYTTVVGFARPVCNPDPAAQLWWGVSSAYEVVNWDQGWCQDGVYYPFGM
jgi:hypothetical protein